MLPQGTVGQRFLSTHQREAPNVCHFPPGLSPSSDAKLPCCLPQTTQRAPTEAHRPCSCRLSSPWAWPARLTHRGHHKRSCRSPEPASSSSARCGTGSPRRRSWSIRSTGWSPTSTSTGRESTKENPGKGTKGQRVAGECVCSWDSLTQ